MHDDRLDPNDRVELDIFDLNRIPDREFWDSLRVIFKYYLAWEFRLFWMKPWFLRPPTEVFDSLRHINSWLADADEAGVFDEDSEQ